MFKKHKKNNIKNYYYGNQSISILDSPVNLWTEKESLGKKENSIVTSFDYISFFAFLILITFGLFMILNISSARSSLIYFYRQLAFSGLSLLLFFIFFKCINLTKLRKLLFPLLVLNIGLLILVLIVGREVKGAVRSLHFMGIGFQPSVLARIMLVLYFAHFFEKKKDLIKNTHPIGFIKNFSPLIIITVIVFVIVLKQRHLSTLIISSLTLMSIMFLAKVRLSTIILIIISCLIVFNLVINKGASFRSSRMEIYRNYSLFHNFLGSEKSDIDRNAYQIKESLTALSNGGFLGRGVNRGKGKHYYLPEVRTDYIFSAIGEELGFLGAVSIFLLYVVIFLRCMLNANLIKDLFLKITAMGLTLNIFYNVIVNVGVAISALPSTGVTLPFISYGGTSLMINTVSLAIILNITAVRQKW